MYVHATGGNGPAGTIIITGAIGDYGKTLSIDRNGKADNNGNYVEDSTLQKGTFEVNSTVLNAKTNHARPAVDTATCSFRFAGTAPVTLFNGTGLYEGIKGKVLITVSYGGVGSLLPKRTAQGPMQHEQQRTVPGAVWIDHGPGIGLVQLTDLQRLGQVRWPTFSSSGTPGRASRPDDVRLAR